MWVNVQLFYHLTWQLLHFTQLQNIGCRCEGILSDFSWWRTTTGARQQRWRENWEKRPVKVGKRTMWLLWSERESSTLLHPWPSKTSKPTSMVRHVRWQGILFPQAPASSCRTWKIIKENEMRLFYIFASALKAVIFLSGSCILSLDASIWSWGNGVPDRISQDSYKILVLRGKM